MLHNTLSALLVSLTSRYAKLSPSDVGIGIGGGRLVIDNVELRADTFNGPHLPFHVYQGRAGRLRVNVPWRALSSTPVQLYLENVHLIAGPKSPFTLDSETLIANDKQSVKPTSSNTTTYSKPPTLPIIPVTPSRDHSQVPWHQTNVGRLLFNVSVEIYGLKVEYRDDDCIGILSIASLRAFSAGPDWSMRFVSFAPDLDRDRPDATAVSMRKTVKLAGVHIVMIPRIKPVSDPLSSDTSSHINRSEAAFQPVSDENGCGQTESIDGSRSPRSNLDHPDRNLDLNSFESKSPILDGASISLRVLLCIGATNLASSPNVLTPGMHGEVSVEIDDPTVKLTARQLVWLDNILKQALSVVQVDPSDIAGPQTQSRRPESKTAPEALSTTAVAGEKSVRRRLSGDAETADKPTRPVHDVVDENPRSALAQNIRRRKRVSGFMSVWEAIVGENSDETVDDAAIALGLRDPNEDNNDEDSEVVADTQVVVEDGENGESLSQPGYGHGGAEGNDVGTEEGKHNVDVEKQYARKMVATAAQSGGVTWEVRLRMTDTQAWDRIYQLEREASETKARLAAAEARVSRANTDEVQTREALERAESAERRADELVGRNAALVAELRELERLAEEANKTKDVMIRQTQSALAEAESKLLAFYEKEGSRSTPTGRAVPDNPSTELVQVNGKDISKSIEIPDDMGDNDEHSEQNEEVVILHDNLDFENDAEAENDDSKSNFKSEDSSTHDSIVVHDSPEGHEDSGQNISEENEGLINGATTQDSDISERGAFPMNLSEGTMTRVGTEERTDNGGNGGVEGREVCDGPGQVAQTLAVADVQSIDFGIRHQEIEERNTVEIPLSSDDGLLSDSVDVDPHGLPEQMMPENETHLEEKDVRQTRLSNFEGLQQKMGYDGLTLI